MNKANPPRLFVIFSGKVVPYSQTSNPVYNTVRNEIRRIDNFEEKEIRRKGKKYKLNSRIHASRHYHKGNRDQAGFLYELFYFPSTSKSPRQSFANLQMLIWWCGVCARRACDSAVSRRVMSRRVASHTARAAYCWPEFYRSWHDVATSASRRTSQLLITCTFIASRSSKICSSTEAR